jgi:hypothetical protein
MRGRKRLSTPALALVTALAPTVLIIVALIVAMFATDSAETVIAVGIAAMLAAFYLLRRQLLRRPARRDRAAAIQRTDSREVTNAGDRSWPVNRPRSPVADDVREPVS